jgi:hypothetical protein
LDVILNQDIQRPINSRENYFRAWDVGLSESRGSELLEENHPAPAPCIFAKPAQVGCDLDFEVR